MTSSTEAYYFPLYILPSFSGISVHMQMVYPVKPCFLTYSSAPSFSIPLTWAHAIVFFYLLNLKSIISLSYNHLLHFLLLSQTVNSKTSSPKLDFLFIASTIFLCTHQLSSCLHCSIDNYNFLSYSYTQFCGNTLSSTGCLETF